MPDPAPLARVYLPDGIAAGTFNHPSQAGAVLCVRRGAGWTTEGGTAVTLLNGNEAAVVGPKVGWAARRDDGSFELIAWDD
jgi:hypothetical protein